MRTPKPWLSRFETNFGWDPRGTSACSHSNIISATSVERAEQNCGMLRFQRCSQHPPAKVPYNTAASCWIQKKKNNNKSVVSQKILCSLFNRHLRLLGRDDRNGQILGALLQVVQLLGGNWRRQWHLGSCSWDIVGIHIISYNK